MPLIPATFVVLQVLIDVFEAILKFFHNQVGVSWGFSIVLMTLVVRAALLPLTLRQFHSMQALARLQPQMKELQAKYKEDKQRLNQEMMKLYQENKVNPFGSCLPLVAQLPVFFALFYMLRKDLRLNICPEKAHAAIHLGHNPPPCGGVPAAHFLWIGDITDKATGGTLVILIVLYVGSQLLSSLLMSVPGQDRNQRMLLLAMPFFFVIFVARFPAGLLVYWITTNLWTIVQQYIVRKRVGVIQPVRAATATAGGAAPAGNGAGDTARRSGGLFGALTARAQAAAEGNGAGGERDGAGTGGKSRERARTPASPPPPSPRKKKKRSGRRR